MSFELSLYFAKWHIFTQLQFDKIFFSVDNFQFAIFVKFPNVSGSKPSNTFFFKEIFLSFFW